MRSSLSFLRRALGCLVLLCACRLGAAEAEIWRLDSLAQVGGHAAKVVGAPEVVDLKGGRAMAFNGVGDGLFVPEIPIAGADAFTIELLFCPDEGGGEAQRFFHLEDADRRRALLELRANGRGGWWLDVFLRSDGDPETRGLTLIDPSKVHPTGRWYWLAMRCDGHRVVGYVNGVNELEGEHPFRPFKSGKVSLGVRQNLVYWFKGAIREVRFHREAIPEAKLQRIE